MTITDPQDIIDRLEADPRVYFLTVMSNGPNGGWQAIAKAHPCDSGIVDQQDTWFGNVSDSLTAALVSLETKMHLEVVPDATSTL